MARFAVHTKVSPNNSRDQIERTLMKYGASKFGYMSEDTKASIVFEAHQRHIRLVIPLPLATDRKREQKTRQMWRILFLAVKAKLEAVESGLSTFETEFLPFTVLPSGQTVSEWIQPQLQRAYHDGKMPPLLLTSGSSE